MRGGCGVVLGPAASLGRPPAPGPARVARTSPAAQNPLDPAGRSRGRRTRVGAGEFPGRPGAGRVSCAARCSAPNKPFKVSGARKFSEIKRRRGGNLFYPDLLSVAVWPPVGVPPTLYLASPENQPPFFLFLMGKGDKLASGCRLQTCRLSPIWKGR